MRYSICIATYKRPLLLEKLLNSLIEQQLPENCEIEALVVDNDPYGTAKSVIDKFSSNKIISFNYFNQPEKNISLTRNMAVTNASGKYLLFIDDDEIADKKWVASLIDCIEKFNADAAFGRVISYFEPGVPDWKKKSFFFNRRSYESGTEAIFTRTGNCIVKSSAIKNLPGPFDPVYGISGGEDTQLFSRVRDNGAKLINCYEAITYEYVPPERTKVKWLLKRSFRLGNNFAIRSIELSVRNKIFIRLKHAFISLVYFVLSLLISIILFPVRDKSFNLILKAFSNAGKFAAVLGIRASEYK